MYGNAIDEPHYMEFHKGDAKPTGEVIHFGIWRYVDQSDTRPLWESREPSEGGEVIKPYGEPRTPQPAGQPYYCDPSYGREGEADKVAEAVRKAVLDGKLSARDLGIG